VATIERLDNTVMSDLLFGDVFNMSPSLSELATALAKAQGEIGHASKDSSNPFFKSKYADLASVHDAYKEIFAKHGLSIPQFPIERPGGRIGLITMLMHSSGQYIWGLLSMKPVKEDPQSAGSCITYMRRYCASSASGVTQDDDDGNKASAQRGNKKVFDATNAEQVSELKKILQSKNLKEESWKKVAQQMHGKEFIPMEVSRVVDSIC